MKKVISFILVISILLGLFAGLSFNSFAADLPGSGSCGDNVTYTFNSSTGLLTISGAGEMKNYSSSSSNRSPFYNQTSVKTVVINSGVTSIGSYAFVYCEGLTSITIPDSVTSIGSHAFHGCSGLTSITIPDSVTSIGGYAFYYCTSITSITIPDSITSIGDSAFYHCTGLTNIKIPASVTSIGEGAFYGCSNLTSITIPDSVTSIGYGAFFDCTGLTSINIPDSVTSISDYAFKDCSSLKSITIGNSVTSIGSCAFEYCSGLTSITIPDSVTSIGYRAFYNCSSLKELTMPCSAKIDNSQYTFYNCTNIEKVTLTKGTGTMQNYASATGYSDTYYQYTPWYISRNSLKTLVIEDGVTNIGSSAFSGCRGLTSITIPDSVTSIGDYAFEYCSSLKSITIPDSVTSIGDRAFSGCSCLTSVKIGNSVTSIGYDAFYGCSGLTSITIPDSVTSIGDYAFWGCNNINDVYYTGSNWRWKAIYIDEYNENLTNAKFHYNYNPYISHEYKINLVKPKSNALGYTQYKCTCGEIKRDNNGNICKYNYIAPTGKPSGLKCASRKATSEKFTWAKTSGVSGYQIQLLNSANKQVALKSTNSNAYTFSKLTAGTAYKARVRFYITKNGKNYYGAWTTLTSPTLPSGTTISKLTAKKKAFTAQWKKNNTVSGYQIQYAKNSKFKDAKSLKYKRAIKLTIKSKKGGKKYFVRVRTYKTIAGKTYYSTWSKTKSVVTKK